ncbi:hypothetical protein ACF06Q_09365 [Streptomyces leeuwenhoekii]|uniref:hypothetical protein n=1 Tax=Streptomyces leeuwenhoekii TaxID=1437453 RepID=UPI0036FE2492
MFHSTWAVTVRMEKGGQYAEYDDTMSAVGDIPPTEEHVIEKAKDMIIDAHPEMKAGRVTVARAHEIP